MQISNTLFDKNGQYFLPFIFSSFTSAITMKYSGYCPSRYLKPLYFDIGSF